MHLKFYAFLMAAALTFVGCATTTTTTTKVIVPRFTSIEKLMAVPIGTNFAETVRILESQPYEVLLREERQSIYMWYYKHTERWEEPLKLSKREGMKDGDETLEKQSRVFLVFESDKLSAILTDYGKAEIKDSCGINVQKYFHTQGASGAKAEGTAANGIKSETNTQKKGFFAWFGRLFKKKKKT